MVDVAKLGLEVDSRPVRQGTKALDRLSKTARTTTRETNRTAQAASRLGGALKGAVAGFVGLQTVRAIRNTVQTTAAISELADVAGVTSETLQELTKSFSDMAGVSEEITTGGLRRFNRRLGLAVDGGGAAKETFEQMGIALRDGVGGPVRDTDEVLRQVIRDLANMEDASLRTARASRFFGEDAGPKMAAAIGQGNDAIERQIAALREDGRVLSNEVVAGAREANDEFERMSDAISTEFTRRVVENKDALIDMASAFSDIAEAALNATDMFVKFGKSIGESLAENDLPGLDSQIDSTRTKMQELLAEFNRPRIFRINPFQSTEDLASDIDATREKLERLEAQRDSLASMPDVVQTDTGRGDQPESTTTPTSGAPIGGEDKIREDFEKRREALLQGLETERQTVLREFGETGAEIQALEQRSLEEGGITQMQAANLRIANEEDKQARLTEITRQANEERNEIEREALEERKNTQQRLNASILSQAAGFASNVAGVIKDAKGEESDAYKAAFLAQQAFAFASTIVNAETAAAAALAPPPIGLGPVAGAPYSAVIRGLGYASAGVIAGQTLASFDGGGFTGSGARTGGVDGRGGFPAILHPNETVVDHTRNQGGSRGDTNFTQVLQVPGNIRSEVKQQILESLPMMKNVAKQAVIEASGQGGSMSRAVGRRR